MSIHVLPINDRYSHDEGSENCPCMPDIEYGETDEDTLVIHHSFDGRELKEGGRTAERFEEIQDVRDLIMENLGGKPKKKVKKPDIVSICNKCGKLQEPDKSKSNQNWSVYGNEPCSCGGKFELRIKKLAQQFLAEREGK